MNSFATTMQSIPAAIADFNPLAESSITTVSGGSSAKALESSQIGFGMWFSSLVILHI